MPDKSTVDDLFDMAIAAERTAEALYESLHDRFAAYPPVASFWHTYACEEAGHANCLQEIRDGIPANRLASQADPEMLDTARRNLAAAQRAGAVEIRTMDDAYQLAHELEHSEVNTLLDLLVTNFVNDAQAHALLRSQLREHIDRLMTGFPAPFTVSEARRAVRPRRQQAG